MLLYWIWLESRKGISRKRKLELVERFQSVRQLWEADVSQIEALLDKASRSFADKSLEDAQEILNVCAQKGISILTYEDEAYPQRLKQIADPPLVLYWIGTLPQFDREVTVGVVGTRKASAYGLMTAENMSYQIAKHGGLVVSGMAAGIDAQAAWGALRADAPTVGVLGCGVDHIYPAQNRELYAQISKRGCLLSEYPPGTKPNTWTFPQRNRIVSGLSCAVLVVEAPEKSGTLITAEDAVKQGRTLFVVPGHVGSSVCLGSNRLLRDGARAATCGWDVVAPFVEAFPGKLSSDGTAEWSEPELPIPQAPPVPKVVPVPKATPIPKNIPRPEREEPAIFGATREEEKLLRCLMQGACSVDQLVVATGLQTEKVLAVLTMLEIKGQVRVLPGRRVTLS